MALSTAIFVGDTKSWIPELVQRAQSLKVAHTVSQPAATPLTPGTAPLALVPPLLSLPLQVNAGDQPGADLGPLISPEAKDRVCNIVQSGVDEGAKVLVQFASTDSTCHFPSPSLPP